MKRVFSKVTKDKLHHMTCKWYGVGKELQVDDNICSGFTINYANIYGTPPSEHNLDNISLSLKMFVEKDGMLYELYKKSN